MSELKPFIDLVTRNFKDLFSRVAQLEMAGGKSGSYKGASAIDFTTTTLPAHGDYGYQSVSQEIQVNCSGTIRAITTSAL